MDTILAWLLLTPSTRLQRNKNQRISLEIFIVSLEPHLQLFCVWSINQNYIKSELLKLVFVVILREKNRAEEPLTFRGKEWSRKNAKLEKLGIQKNVLA